jgi:hypothetical protein
MAQPEDDPGARPAPGSATGTHITSPGSRGSPGRDEEVVIHHRKPNYNRVVIPR